jgi:uncharacterized protein YbaR (Trm112 family)
MSVLLGEHIALLVCPVCHAALALTAHDSIQTVDCTGCHRRYPIVDGLPVLIASRATCPESGIPPLSVSHL